MVLHPTSAGMLSASRWYGCLPLREDGVEETAKEQEGLYGENIVHRLGGGDQGEPLCGCHPLSSGEEKEVREKLAGHYGEEL